jgi:hypothetical protein
MYNADNQEIDPALAERLEAAIAAGIRQGRTELLQKRNRYRRRMAGAVAACLLVFACFFTIWVSPAFAAIVRDIPGLEKFVDLISRQSDKGLQLAVDNDFIQPVGVSDEHDGMKFTVEGIIADDSRMVVFYDIHMPDKNSSVQIDRPGLSDAAGKELPSSIGFDYPDEAKQDIRMTGIQRGTADFQLSRGASLPGEVVLSVKLKKSGLPDASAAPKELVAGSEGSIGALPVDDGGIDFKVKIPIDRTRFAGLQKEYTLGQTIRVEGQAVTFAKAVVSPLRVSLYMDYDESNTKQIFGPGDIRIVDDKGNVWGNKTGSLVKDHPVYHFESPYFTKPKSLTIEGSWFRALDKNRMSVTVDTEKGRLLQAPDGKLGLYKVTKNDTYTQLDFVLNGLDLADKMMYSSFAGEFTDATGKMYKTPHLKETISGYIDGSKPGEQHSMFYIGNESYKQPLTFTLSDYPAYIYQPYKIRIE